MEDKLAEKEIETDEIEMRELFRREPAIIANVQVIEWGKEVDMDETEMEDLLDREFFRLCNIYLQLFVLKTFLIMRVIGSKESFGSTEIHVFSHEKLLFSLFQLRHIILACGLLLYSLN